MTLIHVLLGDQGQGTPRDLQPLPPIPARASEELLDCVNQSLFAPHTRTLGERLFLIYKF